MVDHNVIFPSPPLPSPPLSRLCEKFAVHSQPEKAAGCQRLTEEFLGCSLERSYPRVTSVHCVQCCFCFFTVH